jgi:ribose 5-phosphate isomerase B
VKVYASSDHAGFALRAALVQYLREQDVDVDDRGPSDPQPLDYPDEAVKVARLVRDDPGSRGLLVCGSGVGMCIAANKVNGVRAMDAWNAEAARLGRSHNDANVLCVGERMVSDSEARAIVDAWLSTPFEGGRHARRLEKIAAIEAGESDSRNRKVGK